jgi:O-antigen/teichoic acid export membrane protein
MVFLALMADKIILLWLGPTWMDIVPLVRVLCMASLALFAASLTYPILVAVGRIQDTVNSSFISLPPSLIVIFIAAPFGVQAVATSALLTLPFQAFVAIYFIARHLSLSPSDLIRATLKSGLVTVCSAASAMLSVAVIKHSGASTIAELALASTFAAAGWGLGLLVTDHPLLAQLRVALSGIALAARASLR